MFLSIQQVQKMYGNKAVLRNINFELEAHQTLSILGKSGCGKSTLLKLIAGLDKPDQGSIHLNGKDMLPLAANERNIVYLFQEALLFPHLNVFENIAFGLRIRKVTDTEIRSKVNTMLAQLQLSEHRVKMPHQLSGGQKQRVAFGRALILNPPLILLDEPFSSLDVETRAAMQHLYKSMAQLYKLSALFVSHDLKEALLMGDKIAFMEEGVLELFPSKKHFIESSKTGVQQEIEFWNKL